MSAYENYLAEWREEEKHLDFSKWLAKRLEEEEHRNDVFGECLRRGLKMWQEANPDKDYWISGDENIKWMLDQIAALREQVTDVNELLWEFAENPNIELGEKGHSKIEDYFKKYAKQEAQ